jgi:glycosyl transferase family 25
MQAIEIEKHLLETVFDQIYIINLIAREDRRAEMKIQLKKVGLNYRESAVQFFSTVKPESAEDWPTRGTKGCFMSHMNVLKNAKLNGYQKILIIEDDLNFSQNFNIHLPAIIEQLNTNSWDLFYGGYQMEGKKDLSPQSKFKTQILNQSDLIEIEHHQTIHCAHFIGFNEQAINELPDYLEAIFNRPSGDPKGGHMPIDGAYHWYRKEHPNRKTLISVPPIGYQRSSRSDIHELPWFDKAPVINNLTSTLRKLKQHLTEPEL